MGEKNDQDMSDTTNQESFRDKVATVDKKGKRIWMFPQKPEGRLYNLRKLATSLYLVVFFGLPFLKYDGHPIFLLNILERKFILFGENLLAAGFLHIRDRDDSIYRLYRVVYGSVRPRVLWVGMSADCLYGDAVPQY